MLAMPTMATGISFKRLLSRLSFFDSVAELGTEGVWLIKSLHGSTWIR